MSPAAIVNAAPSPSNGTKIVPVSSVKPIITPSSILPPAPSNSVPAWVQPDLTRLLRVEHLPGSFAARSVSLVDLPAGAIFARISGPTPASCAYTSVQASRDLHIELNSDLVFINHSCRPTLLFDMTRWEVRVNPELKGGLKAGDELTFFYPSTEWDMVQPFDCRCREASCRGTISGAKDMELEVLSNYWLNPHIEGLLQEKHAANGKGNGVHNGVKNSSSTAS
ncbi:uncharacterized protein BDR25DRAFT_302619 [Lindgomyces ingoldianus]|uniref:Uncharacterized protein n=1 Tax=Lindgomyces ingoldianus TaxID=673940 RepID=A0ACB6R275_9PLEO|nr:uncharacterized protein BDR25DRAFT_302619 [Lindgomyces ingoldianus]KAF2472430.1 hypothetical protein BDR25DRAFT_302619 [Lindgomyces ingoldianus]